MRKTLLLLSILFLFMACNPADTSKKEESIMYEDAELALLMRSMYSQNEAWRQAILEQKFETNFPTDFYGIYTVEATDSNVRTEQFVSLTDAYLASVKDLIESEKSKKQVKKFNLSIDQCIACHNVFCQGPIDKIKKLYIVE
ncbi:MAG: hypothetical protein H6579_01320 [Chitinophagales bacterium]|nr:hypothetical protein [Bacteroidota bacterium]MCB9255750.1 hypothetical protein [Chitinophagales bacterium]